MSQDGLEAVFLAQRPQLLRLLKARLRSTEDAEDCLQDLWLKLDQLGGQPIGNPAAFLFRAATNLATDRRIAADRRAVRDKAWVDQLPAADDLPDAERTVAARQEWAALDRAIASMPVRMATALRLFRLEGAGQRAIAEHLGVSVSAVEKLLHRAYRQLAEFSRTADGESGGPRRHDCEGSAKTDG